MNPLVLLILLLIFSLSTLFSDTLLLLLIHLIISLLIIFSIRNKLNECKVMVAPFIKFLPLTGLIFFFISILFSNKPIFEIILNVSLATIRLIVLSGVMTVYIIQTKEQDTYAAIRSIWYSFKKSWRWMDDLFLYFDIIIRFFPSFQEEWKRVVQSQKALGFHIEQDFFKRLKSIAIFIPDFIILNLNRADTLTAIVLMRGYGTMLPRSVYPFTAFHWSDVLIIAGIIVCLMGILLYVPV